MSFHKGASVIGICIRMHNYYIRARLDLEQELKHNNGVIEVNRGVMVLSPNVWEAGIPVGNLHRE